MRRRNRVDPWGDLHAEPGRGMFTGNRGCLVDDAGSVVRHHRSTTLWITCVTSFRGRRHPLDAPHIWTPVFFLDEAVALAAGHRPCAFCRREDYRSYRDAVSANGEPLRAAELDRRLARERLRRGRGLSRAADRLLWTAPARQLPDGTVVLDADRRPCLLIESSLRPFTFDGWGGPMDLAVTGTVEVLTPPMSVAALAAGYLPTLHPSASCPSDMSTSGDI